MSYDSTYAAVTGWAEDFISAFGDRPRIFRWLAFLFMGRYARNEMIGIAAALYRGVGLDYASWGYSLQDINYHKKIDRCNFNDIPAATDIIWPRDEFEENMKDAN